MAPALLFETVFDDRIVKFLKITVFEIVMVDILRLAVEKKQISNLTSVEVNAWWLFNPQAQHEHAYVHVNTEAQLRVNPFLSVYFFFSVLILNPPFVLPRFI